MHFYFTFINFHASLLKCFCHLLARNRSEQASTLTSFSFQTNRHFLKLLTEVNGFLLLIFLPFYLCRCLMFQCFHITICSQTYKTTRNQKILCIPFRYFFNFTFFTLSFNILQKDYFHSNNPSSFSISSSTASSFFSASAWVPSSCTAALVK
ncbi:hypothetical protein D3C81_1683300 [compost metagenome]